MHVSIGHVIMREERFMQVTMRNIIESYGKTKNIKPIYVYILDLISQCDGQTIKHLCEMARMKPSNVSPICHRLEDAGYIKRKRDIHDGRSFCLFLTPAGEQFLEELDDWFDQVLSCAGEENEQLHDDVRKGFLAFRRLIDLAAKQIPQDSVDEKATNIPA